jgi:hypothetical protein
MNTIRILALLTAFGLAGVADAQQTLKHKWVDGIDERKPDIVLIGNSMIGEGIDVGTLSTQTKSKIYEIRDNGQLTAWQYMVVKNVIGSAKHVPKLVVVVERINSYTTPQVRVTGDSKNAIDELRNGDEKVLDALAYGVPPAGKEILSDLRYWDFKANVEKSFLPHMIEAAKKKGTTLVVVRHKSREFAEDPEFKVAARQPYAPLMKQYRQDMADYIAGRGMVFLDFELEPKIKIEHYGNGSHLNRGAGRALWTGLMSEDLAAILAGKTAPHQLGAEKPR